MVLRFEGVRRPVGAGRWLSCGCCGCCCWSEVESRDRDGGRWVEVMANERVAERSMDDIKISFKKKLSREGGKGQAFGSMGGKSYSA